MASKDKYDRQLRLWGVNGQRKLSNAHVLLAGEACTSWRDGTFKYDPFILNGTGWWDLRTILFLSSSILISCSPPSIILTSFLFSFPLLSPLQHVFPFSFNLPLSIHVLLISRRTSHPGANAVGSETLKNLILPGVGRFTVLDSARGNYTFHCCLEFEI